MLKEKKWERETGQSMILFALLTIMLMGVLALVIDYGMPAFVAGRLQNAADSAALAAATELPTKDTAIVKNEAVTYASHNGFSNGSKVNVQIESSYRKVTVMIEDRVDYSFARIFGITGIDLKRRASAELKGLSGIKYAVPLSIEKSAMDTGIASGNYYMTLKFGGGSGTNGAYGALDLDGSNGSGASGYKDRLIHGYSGIISVGDTIPTENGNMSGPTEQGVQQRYEACTHYTSTGGCTAAHYDVKCPRVMLIPVVTYISSHEVKIEGFAAFLLDSYHGSGNECFVYGTYLPSVIIDGEIDPDKTENPYGTYGVELTE